VSVSDDPARALEHTLRALRGVARAGPADALVARVEEFLRELRAAGTSAAGVDALRAAVDDWLGQMVGPLLGRVGLLLGRANGRDTDKIVEVLRALWVLLGDASRDARAALAEVGGLLTTSLQHGDAAGARRALAAARAWLDEHQWVVASRLRRPFGER
jgi:hypothetical protein